ncbi:MAG: TldD/PmbA family protein [Parvularculaceae bacterium]
MTNPDFDADDAERALSRAIESARSHGADAGDAVLMRGVSSSVTWRMGALEDAERAESLDLGLRAIVGERSASVSTTDLSDAGLGELVARCVAMAKAAPPDPYVGLAPEARLARPPFPDLDLGDFDEPDTETLKRRAADCEAAALGVAGVVNSGGAGASYGEGRKWLMTSHGFFGESGGASHSVSTSVIAEDANGKERDYDYDSKTHYADMRAPEDIGRRAGARTVARLSPRKAASRRAPVIYDKRLSASLVGHLTGAINGAAIARGVSFLKDKLGERIFPAGTTVRDDPFRKRGAGSRPFDGEGVAPEAFDIIDDGVLTTWLMNTAHARQLGLQTSGRATRGVGGAPGAGATNCWLLAGEKSVDDLMREAGEGLLLTEMFGPQVNANTGDYSVGCSGFWFEDGAVAYPVSEITVAGVLLDMFATLVPADDLEFRGAKNAPSVFIPEMTIAGD